MGDLLEQVKNICCQLDDSKITTRKKAEEQLTYLLNNNSLLVRLDNVSVSKKEGSAWKWQDVYRTTFGYLKKEVDKIIDDMGKEKQAKTAATLRENKKRTAIGLYRMVIKKGRKHLNWSSVLNDFLLMLEQPFMRASFSEDVVRLMVDVVTNPSSRAMLRVTGTGIDNQWERILDCVKSLFNDPPSGLDSLHVCQLFHYTIDLGSLVTCMHEGLARKEIWKLMRQVLDSDKIARPDSEAKIECVKAANSLLTRMGLNCREMAVALGEATVQSVIRVWADKREREEVVLKFLNLQMIFHHPGGAFDAPGGALFGDREVWTRQLRRIYQNIIDTTIRNRVRYCRQKNSRLAQDFELQRDLVDLGVSVVYQLMMAPGNELIGNVTQIVELDETQVQGPAKRRRLSNDQEEKVVGLDLLVQELQVADGACEESKIPWLQLLSVFVKKHPLAVKGSEDNLVKIIAGLLQSSRSIAVRRLLLEVCRGLLLMDVETQEWKVVARCAITMLSSNQLGLLGHHFLRTLLIKRQGQVVAEDVYSVYSNRMVKPCKDSIETLVFLLDRFPLKDLIGGKSGVSREELLDWLRKEQDQEGENKCFGSEMALLLVKLTTKREMTEIIFKEADQSVTNSLKELENSLLELVCAKNIVLPMKKECVLPKSQPVVLPDMIDKVQEILIQEAGEVLDRLNGSLSGKTVETVLYLVKTLLFYLSALRTSDQSHVFKKLSTLIKHMLSKAGTATEKVLSKRETRRGELFSILHAWKTALRDEGYSQECIMFLYSKNTELESMVAKLEWMVSDVCRVKETPASQANMNTTRGTLSTARNGSATPDPFDDFDDFDNDSADTIEDTNLDLSEKIDTDKDAEELGILESCISVLAALCSPVTGDESGDVFSDRIVGRQVMVVQSLKRLIKSWEYSEESMKIMITICQVLMEGTIVEDTVEELKDLMMDIAQTCMTSSWFNYSGILGLCKLMSLLTKEFHYHGSDNSRTIFTKILQGLAIQNSKRDLVRLGPDIMVEVVKIVADLGRLGANWAEWSQHNTVGLLHSPTLDLDTDEQQRVSRCLPRFLAARQVSVRLTAAHKLLGIASSSKVSLLKNILFPAIKASYHTFPESSVSADIIQALAGSASSLLASITAGSPSIGRVVVSCLISLHSANLLEHDLLARAVNLVAVNNHQDKLEFLKTVLPGLLFDHYVEGGKLANFPKKLFGYRDEQLDIFVRENESVVCPLTLLHSPTDKCLSQLGELLGKEPGDILKDNFDKLAQLFLPGMASKEFKIDFDGSKKMSALADFIDNKYENFLRAVIRNFPTIMQQLFLNVNDPEAMISVFQLSKVEKVPSNPPELGAQYPNKIAHLLRQDEDIWCSLAINRQDSVVRMAVTIISNLSSSYSDTTVTEQLRYLHSLYLWLDCIGPSVSESMTIVNFLSQYVCKSLLNMIVPCAKSDFRVVKASIIVLNKFLNIIIPIRSSSLIPVLYSVNYCLVSLSMLEICPEELILLSIGILENIFIDNSFRFSAVFSQLEDYPNLPKFSPLQAQLDNEDRSILNSLSGQITRFMNVASVTDSLFMELPLKTLKRQLKSFADKITQEVRADIVRNLVCMLLKIVRSSTGVVETEALQSLAELGPIDLESQVLELEPSSGQSGIVMILNSLKTLMLGNDGAVSRSAASAIATILTYTEEGQNFLKPVEEESHEIQNLKEILQPFVKTRGSTKHLQNKEPNVNEKLFRTLLDESNIWSEESSHSEWITNLVTKMLSCFHERTVFRHLIDVCHLSPKMGEVIFPFIVFEFLSYESSDIRLILSAKFSNFFTDHFDTINNKSGVLQCQNEKGVPYLRKGTILAMLSVVSYLREQPLPEYLRRNSRETNSWENNFWFANINYLYCAQAALSCGAYFSALQMCNIWCLEKGFQIRSGKHEDYLEGNLFESIAGKLEKEAEIVQDIMYQASLNLGDKDAALGAGKSRLVNPATRTAQLSLEGKFGIALPLFDSQTLSLDGPGRQGLLSTLYSSGMHFTLSKQLTGEEKDLRGGGNIVEFQQECSWRLGNWDQFSPDEALGTFHGCILGGLESAVRGDHKAVKLWKERGESVVASKIRSASLESSAGIYPLLSQLRQLTELELLGGSSWTLETFTACISQIVNRDDLSCPDFLLLEPIFSQRLLLLSSSKWPGGMLRNTVKSSLDNMCLHVSRKARHATVFWVCNQLQRFYTEVTYTSRFEEAMVAFGQDQKETGVFLAKKLLLDIDKGDQSTQEMESLLPKVLFCLGSWLHELKCEPTTKILETYLARTVEILEQTENPENISELTEAHMAVATFADQQHKQLSDFMDSTEFKERSEAIQRNLKEADILKKLQSKQKTLNTAKILKERFSNLDTQELELYKTQSEEYLMTSLKHYLSVLSLGDKSLAVYRLVSLWFSNSSCQSVQELLAGKLPSVPSYKFIPLLYQMAARMQVPSQGKQDFSSTLFSLIKRCMEDHPHHAVPIALALANAKEDERQETGGKGGAGAAEDPRSIAAQKLVQEVQHIPRMAVLVKNYQMVSMALINLAYVAPPVGARMGSGGCPIPGDHKLMKVKKLSEVAVPTDTLMVRPDRDYRTVCGIEKFSSTYSMVGGVNAPKKLTCTGTDGKVRLQLVKGKDDLRQDAVMEQVFGLMNNLLDQNEETRKRKLKIRTYKVVPLSQRSGILEWCVNTQPIAMYLVGSDNRGGAHKKYFPKQLESIECRKKMASLNPKSANSRRVPLKQREKLFREVCANFTPAMKFFFLEKFPSPGSYYLAQSSYTRSVATNSMVGHILGLGDRHTNNILIDNSKGELVHIDLGVAFEQGKILPTPETIPFRLTRDIVDGFGPAGVEGVFRRCCERSMNVLRDNKSAILTVLEVLVHDPLYNWSVGPEKAASKQEAGLWEELQKETGQGNRMANRALLVLAAKLEGREEGAPLSVQGQVNTLIQKAMDPANLCAVYEGWAAWC